MFSLWLLLILQTNLPAFNFTNSYGVFQLTAGTGITLSPATGVGVVEISSRRSWPDLHRQQQRQHHPRDESNAGPNFAISVNTFKHRHRLRHGG